MRESVFQQEIVASFKHHGEWAYKLADVPVRRPYFTSSKPFDIVASVRGKMLAVECKQMKRYGAFGLKVMEDSQIVALDELSRCRQARCYVFLNVRITRVVNRLYIFRWENLRHVWMERGSILAEALRLFQGIDGSHGRFPLVDWMRAEGLFS